MQANAYAKLNLYLEVLSKRTDGYHDLKSRVVFLDLADKLSAELATDLSIEGSTIENNIILKSAKLLQEKYQVSKGAKFKLEKNIPVGAGLGGGSADAATAIILLNKLWELNLPEAELYKLGQQIGADVPVCLYSQLHESNSAYFSGLGEEINPARNIPEEYYLLVYPNQPLTTADVFKSHELKIRMPDTNHLQDAAIKLMPEIGNILGQISNQQNVSLSRMTGSGSCCFGIFKTRQDAELAAGNMDKSWWVSIAKPRVLG